MSYRIKKAKKLQEKVIDLQQAITLNNKALNAAVAAAASKYIIEDFKNKEKKLQREFEKASRRFYNYADENIKISELKKISQYEDELYEEDY